MSRKKTLEDMQELAGVKGGECVSPEYVNAHFKLRWQCGRLHQWDATPNDIRNGRWCPHCSRRAKKNLEDMQIMAKEKGGECLSTAYINSTNKLRWRCAEGHEWDAMQGSIQQGGWCPTCSAGNSERISRDIFEQLLNHPFPKARPSWLRNDRGHQMELDGYSHVLRVAFEYQGVQHYAPVALFHRGTKTLMRRNADDKKKHSLCREHSVTLVDIPYTVPLDDVPEYVFRAIHDRGLTYSMQAPETVRVARNILPENLRKVQEMANEKGGECLATAYINNRTKLQWKCAKGHEWSAVASSIQGGGWCPECANDAKRLSIEDMQKIANEKGGKCLSTVYVNIRNKLRWQCAKGHEWLAKPGGIRNASVWCPKCAVETRKATLRKKRTPS